jgi:hypothetical protein
MGVKRLRDMVIPTPTLALPHQGGGNLWHLRQLLTAYYYVKTFNKASF